MVIRKVYKGINGISARGKDMWVIFHPSHRYISMKNEKSHYFCSSHLSHLCHMVKEEVENGE